MKELYIELKKIEFMIKNAPVRAGLRDLEWEQCTCESCHNIFSYVGPREERALYFGTISCPYCGYKNDLTGDK